MNTATTPTQGERPAWQLICVADALDELNADHAFLTALQEITRPPETMSSDARRLLNAYLDADPRQKLTELVEKLMNVARSISD